LLLIVHPGWVYTGFGGIDAQRRPGQRDVDESTRGVIEAIEKTTLETTGSFYHGNYGEGVKPLPW
jgi:tubulin alpha